MGVETFFKRESLLGDRKEKYKNYGESRTGVLGSEEAKNRAWQEDMKAKQPVNDGITCRA